MFDLIWWLVCELTKIIIMIFSDDIAVGLFEDDVQQIIQEADAVQSPDKISQVGFLTIQSSNLITVMWY